MAEHSHKSQLVPRGMSLSPTPTISTASANHVYSCLRNHKHLFIVDRFNFEDSGLTCGSCLARHSFPESCLTWTEAPVASTTGTADQVQPDSFGKALTLADEIHSLRLLGRLRGPPQTYIHPDAFNGRPKPTPCGYGRSVVTLMLCAPFWNRSSLALQGFPSALATE
jgi:hypothetical protein